MKKYCNNIRPIFLIIALPILTVGCNNERSSINTEVKTPVSVISIKSQSISKYIETTGTVYSSQESTSKSEITGLYQLQTNVATGKPFALGDFVKKGQLLIALKDKEYENNLQLEGKKLNLEISQNNYDKQKSLYEKGGVTLTELKKASVEFVNTKYAYENAEIQLEKMSARAPFDGVIVELPYQTNGVKIDQGQVLFKIMKYDRLLLDIKLPEKHLIEIKKGQRVHVTNYNLAKDTLQGSVNQISPIIDPETRTFQSVLEIDNDALLLRPGMFVKAAILSEKHENIIVIPKEVIISRQNKKMVFTVENGIATTKYITTGLENQDVIEVVEGLKVNDRLITAGFETLRNGSKVSVIQ